MGGSETVLRGGGSEHPLPGGPGAFGAQYMGWGERGPVQAVEGGGGWP